MAFNYQAIADTIGTSNFNYFNGLGNMFLARSQSQNLHMLNSMQSCWTGFTPYGNLSGLSYLTDPRYTLGQITWGTPMWNNNWATNNGMNPWGFTPGNSGNGSSTRKPETEEEKTYQKKYNVLLSLLKQLKNYPDLKSTQKELINDAIKNTKGTYEEKFKTLLNAYKAVDKEDIKEFFAVADELGATSDSKKKEDSFKSKLQAIGYEADDSTTNGNADGGTDDIVAEVYKDIESLSDSDSASGEALKVIGYLKTDGVNILDVISSWNTNYKNKDEKSQKLLGHIMKKHNNLSDADAKKDIRVDLVGPIVESLIKEAQRNLKDLTKNSKTNMENSIKYLNDAVENYKENGSCEDTLLEAFDNLYILTRLVATEKLEQEVIDYYGRIEEGSNIDDADRVFSRGMFTDAMLEDLKNEGFDAAAIDKAKTVVKCKNNESSNSSTDDVELTKEQTVTGGGSSSSGSTEAYQRGQDVYNKLDGITTDSHEAVIRAHIEGLNSDNVLSFLKGYYDTCGNDLEGLIEALTDDASCSAALLYTFINKVLEKAKKQGLSGSTEYSSLQSLLNEHKSTGNENMNNYHHGGLLWVVGAHTNYSEEFDTRLEALFKKMRSKA